MRRWRSQRQYLFQYHTFPIDARSRANRPLITAIHSNATFCALLLTRRLLMAGKGGGTMALVSGTTKRSVERIHAREWMPIRRSELASCLWWPSWLFLGIPACLAVQQGRGGLRATNISQQTGIVRQARWIRHHHHATATADSRVCSTVPTY